MRTVMAAVLAFVLVMVCGMSASNAFTPAGPSVSQLPGAAGLGAAPMAIHLYRPERWTPADRILIVLHGRGRNGAEYRDQWSAQSEATNLLIVVPEFDSVNFPGTPAYNYAGVVDGDGRLQGQSRWAFGLIDRVFAHVRATTGATRPSYSLYGHSAGAQFAHRFLLLAAATDADMIITANAGSYTMPTRDVAFPFGLKGVDVSDDDLRRAFARPVIILLGEADNDPNHESLPRQPGAMAQGPDRFARGQRFAAVAAEMAAALKTPFRWQVVTVPGVAHFNAGMAARAAELVAAGWR